MKVFFQTNAWMDQNMDMDWTEQVLFQLVVSEKLDKFSFLCETLRKEEFKAAVADQAGLVWYRLPNGTELWQSVDAGRAQVLQQLVGSETA